MKQSGSMQEAMNRAKRLANQILLPCDKALNATVHLISQNAATIASTILVPMASGGWQTIKGIISTALSLSWTITSTTVNSISHGIQNVGSWSLEHQRKMVRNRNLRNARIANISEWQKLKTLLTPITTGWQVIKNNLQKMTDLSESECQRVKTFLAFTVPYLKSTMTIIGQGISNFLQRMGESGQKFINPKQNH
jgi:hypothetical protein